MNGWECPKCGNVYSPKVQECSACNSAKRVFVPNSNLEPPHNGLGVIGYPIGINTGHAKGASCV